MLPARLPNYVEYLRKMILWQCSVSSALGARAEHFSHGALTVLSRVDARITMPVQLKHEWRCSTLEP